MNLFGKKKGKKGQKTRGLDDHHPPRNHVYFPPSPPLSPPRSSPSHNVSSDLVIAYPYEPTKQAEQTAPQDEENKQEEADATEPSQPDVKFEAMENENERKGIQEIGDIEVGTSSNGVISPIFTSGGKYEIRTGNNKNKGNGTQKIGKITFGNAA